MIERSELLALSEARATVAAWLESYGAAADPTLLGASQLRRVSRAVQRAESAIRGAAPAVRESDAWRAELAEYRQALERLREQLIDYDVRLRVRRDQVWRASARLGAVRSWAHLAKQLG